MHSSSITDIAKVQRFSEKQFDNNPVGARRIKEVILIRFVVVPSEILLEAGTDATWS